jgi:hypothetical protein
MTYNHHPAKKRREKTSRSGGMADALDSKSSVRKGVWVRLPPSVVESEEQAFGVDAIASIPKLVRAISKSSELALPLE